MNISSVTTVRFLCSITLPRNKNSGSAEYANLKFCILRNELLEDCNEMQLISSDSLTVFTYIQLDVARIFAAEVQNMQI